jgi:hypothetical protein
LNRSTISITISYFAEFEFKSILKMTGLPRNNNSATKRLHQFAMLLIASPMLVTVTQGFGLSPQQIIAPSTITFASTPTKLSTKNIRMGTSSNTALNVFWFGGSNTEAIETTNDESCELIAVRIDRTSANSRRIGGEVTVDRPIDDVWAILTDYDNLATHVPNLVESRRINDPSAQTWNNVGGTTGYPGDGSYRCRLYQKGAQKIIGFEFGASVTMDMTEQISSEGENEEERKIFFKCVDSQFFSTFDGEWSAKSGTDPVTGEPVTNLNYVVDVRPKGPVPVAALEWRIREDVPTNLREVKKASIVVGRKGVEDSRALQSASTERRASRRTKDVKQSNIRSSPRMATAASSSVRRNVNNLVKRASSTVASARSRASSSRVKLAPVKVSWYEDETMAAYLKE